MPMEPVNGQIWWHSRKHLTYSSKHTPPFLTSASTRVTNFPVDIRMASLRLFTARGTEIMERVTKLSSFHSMLRQINHLVITKILSMAFSPIQQVPIRSVVRLVYWFSEMAVSYLPKMEITASTECNTLVPSLTRKTLPTMPPQLSCRKSQRLKKILPSLLQQRAPSLQSSTRLSS